MPYTHKKVGDKHCVYKKDSGTKVGCTKGDVNDYLAALHMHANENELKGGLADKLSLNDIADKHKVSLETIKQQLNKGIKIEFEHTNDKTKAREIAMDHLSEEPNYYDKLEKIETNESTKSLIKNLLRESLKKKINLKN